ncbi:MAG: isoprenylcysteine carboxylmethyltransferase family protein [bacterium]|nr:isoprenylcysteine carboxylmethyltransferase family protein [bacterium]
MMRKIFHAFLLKSGTVFFRLRNYLFPIFIIMVLVFTKPALFLGREDIDIALVTLGFIISIGSALFRLFVIGLAYIARGGKDGHVYAEGLVTQGIYAHVRNPMYVANFLVVVGITLIYGSFWLYFVLIPFFAYIYLSIVTAEEDYLRSHYNEEFQAYCQKVNRFIPDFSGLRETIKQFPYDWKKAIRKEFGTSIGILAGSYSLWLYKRYHFYNLGQSEYRIFIVEIPLILLAIIYCSIMYLKKTGRLD